MWLSLHSDLGQKCASFATLTLSCVISIWRFMEDARPPHATPYKTPSLAPDDQPSTSTLKRPPSPSFEGADDEITRKRFKEDPLDDMALVPIASTSKYDVLVEDLAQELQCGCCAELVYRPVVVSPCQHFFCGRYSQLTCPECNCMLTKWQLLCTLDQGELPLNRRRPVPRNGSDEVVARSRFGDGDPDTNPIDL